MQEGYNPNATHFILEFCGKAKKTVYLLTFGNKCVIVSIEYKSNVNIALWAGWKALVHRTAGNFPATFYIHGKECALWVKNPIYYCNIYRIFFQCFFTRFCNFFDFFLCDVYRCFKNAVLGQFWGQNRPVFCTDGVVRGWQGEMSNEIPPPTLDRIRRGELCSPA